MLEFAESVLREIRKLRESAEDIVLGGSISVMERYRFMMGRLDGLMQGEETVKELLKKRTQD